MGFVIFGTQGGRRTLKVGEFNCPQCQELRRYKLISTRQYFSLFFIPVLPLGEYGRYIECQLCGGTFREAVLSYQPGPTSEDIEAEFKKAIRMVMVAMTVMDGRIDSEEVNAVLEGFNHLTGIALSEASIRQEAESFRGGKAELLDYLQEVGGYLNEAGKEQVLRAAIFIAGADNLIRKDEMGLVNSIAGALKMTTAHVNGVIEDMTAKSEEAPKFE